MMTRLLDALRVTKSRHERALVREIVVVLLVKLTVIALAAVFIFGPSRLPHVDAASVEAHLVGALPAASLDAPSASAFANSKPSASEPSASKISASKPSVSKAGVSEPTLPKTTASRSNMQ